MMLWIYKLNWWYDDLDRDHGTLRFFLFIIPMTVFILMINHSLSPRMNLLGLIFLLIFSGLRLWPNIFPRRRPSRSPSRS